MPSTVYLCIDLRLNEYFQLLFAKSQVCLIGGLSFGVHWQTSPDPEPFYLSLLTEIQDWNLIQIFLALVLKVLFSQLPFC